LATLLPISADATSSPRFSTVQHALIEAFAGTVVMTDDLNTRVLRGEMVDVVTYSARSVVDLLRANNAERARGLELPAFGVDHRGRREQRIIVPQIGGPLRHNGTNVSAPNTMS
jgi:hypothetical protein